ncbi:YfiT family bacillithiol transferase [Reichenbachiella versicolor]|uniref:YfiT family bacillithiol transferase n=1 Tax=Reichenbachiella versicolor TaxID=1821036 RepID=UPI000D6E3695|nr:putative metal-dependent hydrolase [Reichenbachiella versicolor]
MDIEKLKFPIGQYHAPVTIDQRFVDRCIQTIESFPEKVIEATESLTEELDWRYRPEGWTIRQVVHHCADSHMNSFVRFKLAMTEDKPTIKPYYEDRWAEMTDYSEMNIASSVLILTGLHARWAKLLTDLTEGDWSKKLIHPEHGGEIELGWMIGNYDWHCEHHLAHIYQAIESKGKYNG